MITNSKNNESTPVIRLATERDAGRIAAIYAPTVSNTIISFEWDAPSTYEMRGRIKNTLERFPWLVCERHGSVSGYAYASAHGSRGAYQWSVDVSAYVHESERRMGGITSVSWTDSIYATAAPSIVASS